MAEPVGPCRSGAAATPVGTTGRHYGEPDGVPEEDPLSRRVPWTQRLLVAAGVAATAAFASAGAAVGVEHLLARVLDGPTAVILLAPVAGLVLNTLIRHYLGRRAGPASLDAYMDTYHGRRVDDRAFAARTLGSAATLGLGGALDVTGLAALLGTWAGDLGRRITRRPGPTMVVIGTAAGLGAVLHSPVAAGVLAAEIPFREGLTWRRLPAAILGSTIGYFARASMSGFGIPWRTAAGVVGLRDIFIALGLAVLAGIASRLVARLSRSAETGLGPALQREWHHVLLGGGALAGLAAISLAGFGHRAVSLGTGMQSLGWAATASTGGLVALLVVRAAANGATVLGRGAGGLVIPLLVLGWIAGSALGRGLDGNVPLLAIVGATTMLGAGYRVPLAALVWLIECTHSFPALFLGAVVVLIAQRVGGGSSVSTAQQLRPRSRRDEATADGA